ncbi:MAG: hypothetical protein ACT4PM_15455 [Gemmatimonadales bacterium]
MQNRPYWLSWLLVLAACNAEPTGENQPPPNDLIPTHPLSDASSWTYLGFPGGQYPDGATMPTAHHADGLARAQAITPLTAAGQPNAAGEIVMLSIGMSNTTQEYCNRGGDGQCTVGSFVQQALADPAVQRTSLVMVDGARGGQTASTWTAPTAPNYDLIRDTRLAPAGVTEQQVQVAWVKVANAQPSVSLPSSSADGYTLVSQVGSIARALKVRYPNLKLVFLSNRTYAGYATTTLNPEPYAYESGFAVKWVIQAQITQMAGGGVDARAGDLNHTTVAPWIGWGPDLWANGATPRPDGHFFVREDFRDDGTHPSGSGVEKVGRLLLDFFKGSDLTRCWFLVSGTCS